MRRVDWMGSTVCGKVGNSHNVTRWPERVRLAAAENAVLPPPRMVNEAMFFSHPCRGCYPVRERSSTRRGPQGFGGMVQAWLARPESSKGVILRTLWRRHALRRLRACHPRTRHFEPCPTDRRGQSGCSYVTARCANPLPASPVSHANARPRLSTQMIGASRLNAPFRPVSHARLRYGTALSPSTLARRAGEDP